MLAYSKSCKIVIFARHVFNNLVSNLDYCCRGTRRIDVPLTNLPTC